VQSEASLYGNPNPPDGILAKVQKLCMPCLNHLRFFESSAMIKKYRQSYY